MDVRLACIFSMPENLTRHILPALTAHRVVALPAGLAARHEQSASAQASRRMAHDKTLPSAGRHHTEQMLDASPRPGAAPLNLDSTNTARHREAESHTLPPHDAWHSPAPA